MIELDSLTVIFMLEASLALFVLIIVLFILRKNNRKEGFSVSAKVIDKLQDTENIKAKKLESLFSAHCDIEPITLNELLGEVKSSERALYRQIIRIYLNKDTGSLNKIDQHIENLAAPYCKAITHSSGGSEKEKQHAEKLKQLFKENERLGEQLTIAMTTMDEISAEYTRVFSGTQTELELENSSKKMFDIFQQARKVINGTIEKG